MRLRATLNPLIEAVATRLFGVDHYPDIFEKLALSGHNPIVRRLCRRRLHPEMAAAPLLFVHVPKNGGTSVKRALYKSDPGHASIRYYAAFFPEYLSNVQSFAILRDPVDRFLSGFDFLLDGGGGNVRIQAKPMRRMRGIETAEGLIDHIDRAVSASGWLAVDTFLRPQSWYLTDAQGTIRVNHLWSLDRAGDGLRAFLRGHGAADLSHINRTQRRKRVLDAGLRDRLQALYPDDFALFSTVQKAGGYTPEAHGKTVSLLTMPDTLVSTAA